LDLWGKFWDYPQRDFHGLYHAKFGCKRIIFLTIQKFEYFVRFS